MNRWFARGWLLAGFVFLYLPIVALVLFSFNDSVQAAFPLQGFTLGWFVKLWNHRTMMDGLDLPLVWAAIIAFAVLLYTLLDGFDLGIGILFNSETGGNNVRDNVFEGNLTQVTYGGRSDNAHVTKNFWEGNYWDDYQGFDRDGDGIGDRTHELYSYADQIWIELPVARFFRSSPVMELLDFLERLAPFSKPDLILRDEKPRFLKPERLALS